MDPYEIRMSGNNNSQGQKIQIEELKDQLAQYEKEIAKLQKKTGKFSANQAALTKYIEAEDKIRNELTEKQNISEIHHSVILEQTAALREKLVDLEVCERKLKEFHNNVIVKQDEQIEKMKGQLDNQSLEKETDFAEQLQLMDEKLAQVQLKYRQAEDQVIRMRETLDEMNNKQEELDRTVAENQQKHEEEIKKLSEIGKDIDAKLEIERGERSQLIARCNEYSIKSEKLSTEYQALQAKTTERKKQLENSESDFHKLREKNENLKSELYELRNEHLAIISERDSELADNRKYLQDLSSVYTETMNKLSGINSNNEKLSDTAMKVIQRNEKLKRDLLDKNDEVTKLSKVLNSATERNKELTTEKQRLSEELVARRKELLQIQVDLKTFDTTQDENGKREIELRAELAVAKQKLQNKLDDKAKLRTEMNNAEMRSINEAEDLQSEIDLKNKQSTELKKIKEDLQKEKERRTSDNDKELQSLTHSSTYCQRAGHGKLIKERNIRIDFLRSQIQAEKLDYKQENVSKIDTEKKEKEKREAQVSEMKSKIDSCDKAISETKELVEDLRGILKKAQNSTKTESTVVQKALNSSELLGIMFAKAQSIPISSTPERSPVQNQRVSFEIEDLSDLSSIDGTDVFEQARRNYAAYLQSKTDSAKLCQKDKKGKS